MLKKISFLSLVFIFLLYCPVLAQQEANKWDLIENSTHAKFFLDNTSVYQEDDSTVSFWLKYIPLDKEYIDFYHNSLINYMKDNNISTTISNKIYCLYFIRVNFEQNTYKLYYHYWYNIKNDSFIVYYLTKEDWVHFEPGSTMETNFLYAKNKIANK